MRPLAFHQHANGFAQLWIVFNVQDSHTSQGFVCHATPEQRALPNPHHVQAKGPAP